jgi:hypothetical protein
MELLRYAEGLFLRAVLSWIFAVVPKMWQCGCSDLVVMLCRVSIE